MADRNTFEIDNITWNDLSLEDIYSRLNSCITSAGEDYLYNRLKNPFINECAEFSSQTKLFDDVEKIDSTNMESILAYISKLKNYSFLEELEGFKSEEKKSNTSHIIIDIGVLLSFAMIFVYPGPGIVLFFGMIGYSVSNYFSVKNIIAGKLTVFNYLIRMINAIKKHKPMCSSNDAEELCNIQSRLLDIAKDFAPFVRGTFIISEGARTNSNPLSLIFDYIRMIFHVDIIKYNSMINFLKSHLDEAIEFYKLLGEIDAALSFSKQKKSGFSNDEVGCFNKGYLCKPDLSDNNSKISVKDIYHPLIKMPVFNSLEATKNILITGCNASGKSTFLKTIAINAIFAQAFGIAFAKEYKAPYYKIFSSMALKDDIDSGESYYMSEIKSIKRILDEANSKNDRILCVIDEVLRGTNTVERIASSVEILKCFSKEYVFCLAATHDIELTELLEDCFKNYHFSEEVLEEDVKFSYRIMQGPAKSRNAIRLLSVLGYDKTIVENATRRADDFVKSGVWN